MAKKRKSQAGNHNRSDNNGTILFAVIIVVLIMALGTMYGISQKNNPGGVSATGGQDTGSLESQVQTLTDQVAKNPKNATLQEELGTALFNLASAYQQSNDPKTTETFEKSINAYNETLKLNPNSKETLGDLATAYFYTNKVDEAITTVEKALKIDPNFLPARMNYGIYLANGKGDYAGAIEQWKKVPSGTPEYDQAQNFIQQYQQSSLPAKSN